MKRNKDYSMRKRTTFLRLFLKAVCVSLICTVIFAGVFRTMLENKVRSDIRQCMTDSARQITSRVAQNETTDKPIGDLSGYMSMYTRYFVLFENLPDFMSNNPNLYQINSDFGNPDNFAMSAIVDKNGNTIATSRAKFTAIFLFGKDHDDNGEYVCDPQQLDIPEVQKLYEDYFELLKITKPNSYRFVTLDIESAYVDKTTHSFIPHEADMQLETYVKGNWSEPLVETEQVDTRHISITLNDENYELVTFNKSNGEEVYPKRMLGNIYGTSWECFDKNCEQVSGYMKDGGSESSGWRGKLDKYYRSMQMPVYVNGEQCTLNLYYHFLAKGTIVEKYYRLGIAIFGVLSVLLALLWTWQKNVRNKARYAFEDYQRDLTDHLAHDIKTPLMAISGYAENVLKGKLTDEEKTEYLNSILDNVSFTDSLISKTLYLNHMGGKITSKEKIQVNDMAEDILSKYILLLHEKKIVYSVSGNAEVHADRTAMETIIENLISNAVKYTPSDGTIRIAIDKKHMTFINSVSEKIDTKELKQPFVRGDIARSNADGNGLGLAIAERAAIANSFKLEISCSDTEFRAEVRF
ncbi:MAG: HAMP domain-containing histidine kinase [Ruminococcus sp.]|nr:HAMP domain-containing histidine kinase [Ruminococcus sp.]